MCRRFRLTVFRAIAFDMSAPVSSLSQIRKAKVSSAQQLCQKCLQSGHWTYECKSERSYAHRPSRTARLSQKNSKKVVKTQEALVDRKGLADQILKERQRQRQSVSSSDDSSSSSDDSSSSSASSSDSDASSSRRSRSPSGSSDRSRSPPRKSQ